MARLRSFRLGLAVEPDASFLAAEDPRTLQRYHEESQTNEFGSAVDLDALDALVERTIADHEEGSTAIDRALIVPLHKLLPIPRREASNPRFWHWMSLVRYPHLVVHRWRKDGTCPVYRFTGSRVRHALARLWWGAELTRDGGDYSLTEEVMGLPGFQDLYEAIFGRGFAGYRPAVEAFIETVGRQPEGVIRETAKELGYVLSTVVLETLDTDDLRSLLLQLG